MPSTQVFTVSMIGLVVLLVTLASCGRERSLRWLYTAGTFPVTHWVPVRSRRIACVTSEVRNRSESENLTDEMHSLGCPACDRGLSLGARTDLLSVRDRQTDSGKAFRSGDLTDTSR